MNYCLCHRNEGLKTPAMNTLEGALGPPQCVDLLAYNFNNLGYLISQAPTAEKQHVREEKLLGGGKLPLIIAHITTERRQSLLYGELRSHLMIGVH